MTKPHVPEMRGAGKMPDFTGTTAKKKLFASRTALVVIDMINWQVSPEGGLLAGLTAAGADIGYIAERVNNTVVPNLQRLLVACRKAGVKVVYTRVGCHRPDFSDAPSGFRQNYAAGNAVDGSWACEVIDALKPAPGELAMMKAGSGSFTGTQLDGHLRNMGITDVLYTGVLTNACVLLAAGSGADLGYRGFVVSDCTATFSQRLQDISEELVSGYMASVVTTAEIIAQLQKATIAAAA